MALVDSHTNAIQLLDKYTVQGKFIYDVF